VEHFGSRFSQKIGPGESFPRDLTNLRFRRLFLSNSGDPLDTRIRSRAVIEDHEPRCRVCSECLSAKYGFAIQHEKSRSESLII